MKKLLIVLTLMGCSSVFSASECITHTGHLNPAMEPGYFLEENITEAKIEGCIEYATERLLSKCPACVIEEDATSVRFIRRTFSRKKIQSIACKVKGCVQP